MLFAVLSALLMQRLYGRLAKGYGIGVILTLLLGVALLQEGIQLFSGQPPLHVDNLFDIGVDMCGGALGVLSALAFRKTVAGRGRAIADDDRAGAR